MEKGTCGKTGIYSTAACGAVCLLLGIYLAFVDKDEFCINLVSQKIALKNNSEALTTWQSTPIPLIFSVYLWNVTNPREVMDGGKPKLMEVGPYVYEKWMAKLNLQVEPNDTISYHESARIFFNQEMSGTFREDNLVTIIHIPIVGAALQLHELEPSYDAMADEAWPHLFPTSQGIFMTGSVKDILFDGIVMDCEESEVQMKMMMCQMLDMRRPKTLRKAGEHTFKFSFFDYKRRVSEQPSRVYRGNDDISKLGEIFSYNNERSLKIWRNRYCNMINGTDGSHFRVNLKPTDTIYMFQPDLCRSLYAKFEKELYWDDLRLYRFVTTADLFASPESNPNNACFCSPKLSISDFLGSEPDEDEEDDRPKKCMKNGALLLTPCMQAPVTATFPHFYLADKSFAEYAPMTPVKELHETFVDIEPLSGIPCRGRKSLQFNIELQPIPDTTLMANVSSGLFPVLWVEEKMVLSPPLFEKVLFVSRLHRYLNVAGYLFAGIGLISLFVAGYCYSKRGKSQSWDMNSDLEGYNGGLYNHGLQGLYSSQMKLPVGVNGQDNLTKTKGLVTDYPIILRRNRGRVYPSSLNPTEYLYADNFM